MSKFNGPTIIIGFFMFAGLIVAPVPQSPASIAAELYTECHGLTESSKFKDMIRKLSKDGQQIPIVETEANWVIKDGHVHVNNYANLLNAIKRFINEVAGHRNVIRDRSLPTKEYTKLWTKAQMESAANFAKTHPVFAKLKEKCGGLLVGVECATVLNDFLTCAGKIRGMKKQTNNDKQNWTGLQEKFEESFLAICKRVEPVEDDAPA